MSDLTNPDRQPTKARRKHRGQHPWYLPTPEQIRQECDRIQATWTETERRQRKYAMPEDVVRRMGRWTPPVISTAELEGQGEKRG